MWRNTWAHKRRHKQEHKPLTHDRLSAVPLAVPEHTPGLLQSDGRIAETGLISGFDGLTELLSRSPLCAATLRPAPFLELFLDHDQILFAKPPKDRLLDCMPQAANPHDILRLWLCQLGL